MMNTTSEIKPLLGVMGGMGTQATACFYDKLHELQPVEKEQDYLDVLICSMPSIPDRTAFITGQSTESPLPHLLRAAKILEEAGATCIALPCATSHYFYDELSKEINIPILNLLEETAIYINNRNIKNVCLLATDGTIKGKAFHRALEKFNIETTIPQPDIQSDLMEIIYDIKKGTHVPPDLLNMIAENILKQESQAVILGCTELCIIADKNPEMINILDVLAQASLNKCAAQ